MRTIQIPETTIIVQEEKTATGHEVVINSVTDDGGCVMALYSFESNSFNKVLWDENTTPTYEEVGVWTDEDVNERIEFYLNQQ